MCNATLTECLYRRTQSTSCVTVASFSVRYADCAISSWRRRVKHDQVMHTRVCAGHWQHWYTVPYSAVSLTRSRPIAASAAGVLYVHFSFALKISGAVHRLQSWGDGAFSCFFPTNSCKFPTAKLVLIRTKVIWQKAELLIDVATWWIIYHKLSFS